MEDGSVKGPYGWWNAMWEMVKDENCLHEGDKRTKEVSGVLWE